MRAIVSDSETRRSHGPGRHAVTLTTGSPGRDGPEAQGKPAGARRSDGAGIGAYGPHFPRSHRIRIAPLKSGNHALVYLFGKSLSCLLQGPAEIATLGIPELGLEPAHTHFFQETGQPTDVDSAYPWPVPQSVLSVVTARIEARLIRGRRMHGREIVFIGQLEDNPFSQQLRQAFPTDTFAHTGSAALDFAIIRQSKFLLLSTSTFAWLAAWLSDTSECIMLPKTGLYSPDTAPEINLIDCSDHRFQFIIP